MRRILTLLMAFSILFQLIMLNDASNIYHVSEGKPTAPDSECSETGNCGSCEGEEKAGSASETEEANFCSNKACCCPHPCCQTILPSPSHVLMFNHFSEISLRAGWCCFYEINFAEPVFILPGGVYADSWRPPRWA